MLADYIGRRHEHANDAGRSTLHRAEAQTRDRPGVRRVHRRVHGGRRATFRPEHAHPVRGFRQQQRLPATGQVPRQVLHVQRRHPGHR